MRSLITKAKMAVLDALPSDISPEGAYAKSVAATLCLLVSADGEYDAQEFQDAAKYIESDSTLRELNMVRRTNEFFTYYCNQVKQVMGTDSIDFPSLQTKMIADIRDCPVQYKDNLKAGIQDLLVACDTEVEREVLRRINL